MTAHPVLMDHVIATPMVGREDCYRLGHGYRTLPTDLPCILEVSRHLSDGDPPGLLGWQLDVTTLGFDEALTLKVVHGGPLQVLVGGREVARLERKRLE